MSEGHVAERIEIFDTTLRDGTQLEGVSVTVDDKLRIAEQLDRLGVQWMEGGWPGANPKDEEFFRRARTELKLDTSTLVAFGSTRRVKGKVDDDATLRNLVEAGTAAVCIVAKSSDMHVIEALSTTLDEGEAMVADSVEFLAGHGLRVMLDAEHFFDGYKCNPEFALRVLEAAVVKGASHLVLCDTNGGSLPFEIEATVADVVKHFGGDVIVGIHAHDDTGCAVANAIAAVRAGARHVQGTINGLGERTGNCNLSTVIPNLSLKLGYETLPPGRMELLTTVSHHVAELVNRPLNIQAPYVGASAFAHKAGLHVSAIAKRKDAYEHVDPTSVGNGTRFVVSELAGRSTIKIKAEQLGLPLDGAAVSAVIDELKRLEHEGYHFEAADASLELLLRRAGGWEQDYFSVESMRVITDELPSGSFITEATVKVFVDGERVIRTCEGNGPVNAIDGALRAAVASRYPSLERVHLTDYKVRILDGAGGTGAVTRVLLDATDGESTWSTIGVSENIIQASWQALSDSIVYGMLHAQTDGVAAPEYVPTSPTDRPRLPWESPDHVPGTWTLEDRPAELANERQPKGPRLGYQGPDQGYALELADRFVGRLELTPGEHAADAVAGSLGVATRRASLFGRAPTVHDLTVAFTIWGFLDAAPPAELLARRRQAFNAVAHSYESSRAIVDAVPEATLRLPHTEVVAAYPARWQELLGG